MRTKRPTRRDERGQVLALFVISLTVIVLAVGLVIDGGTALLQRRASQNASDFAALAGARVIAERIGGDTSNGTDANVRAAITTSISANGGTPLIFGAPNGPAYVDSSGATLGYVGNGSIPGYPSSGACTVSCAVGVTVASSRSWTPYFLGIIGVNNWSAGASSTARGGYAAGGPPGTVFPAAIASAFFTGRTSCSGPVSSDPASPCYPQHLTPGDLNVPGGFGWLKFGCVGFGLGQVPPASNGGCQNNKPFLQTEIGPPGNSFGCCTAVNLPGSADKIGSLPGNKASADCSYYIDNDVVVTVPVFGGNPPSGGTGSNAWYHIIGFTGFQLTACDGGKDIEGVWRVPFFLGPTTTTPGFAGAPLAVQLIK